MSSRGYVVIVSHPRSGSTYLSALLGSIHGLESLKEVFHPDPTVAKSHLGDHFDQLCAVQGIGELEDYRASVLASPESYIATLSDLVDPDQLVFKVFPHHLPPRKLENVLDGSKLVIFLHRNPLHSYISNEIARSTRKWSLVETSDKFPTFEKESFLAHSRMCQNFYAYCVQRVEKCGTPSLIINYEELCEVPRPAEMLALEMQKLGFSLGKVAGIEGLPLKRQDRRDRASDKVKNPDELLSFLKLNEILDADRSSSTLSLDKLKVVLQRYDK